MFSFFKEISVFREKILKLGQELGVISPAESEQIFSDLPTFEPVSAYICGFAQNGEFEPLPYSGKKGRKNFTINAWNGPIASGDLEKIKERENLSGKVEFEGIKEFSHDQGYLFNTGSLLWKKEAWDKIIDEL